jgi:hypothetical protein
MSCNIAHASAEPSARRTIAGYETMAMIRKGRLASIPANDMKAQSDFIARLFHFGLIRVPAWPSFELRQDLQRNPPTGRLTSAAP